MIDALFGSKTRVKLLNLFFNNPGKEFYVREITRIIDEQVNSVRRELSNMQNANVVKSTTKDRKLYYEVNQRYKYYVPLRAIFSGAEIKEDITSLANNADSWSDRIEPVKNDIKLFIISGVLVDSSNSATDMLIIGDNSNRQLSKWAAKIEKDEARELNYTVMSPEEFYYRTSLKDKFLAGIIESKNRIIIDTDNIFSSNQGE